MMAQEIDRIDAKSALGGVYHEHEQSISRTTGEGVIDVQSQMNWRPTCHRGRQCIDDALEYIVHKTLKGLS